MPRKKKPVAAKRAPTPKNGAVQEYTLPSGTTIKAVIADGKPCCPTCDRPLPKQKMLSANEVATLEARSQKLTERLFAEQTHILSMVNKTRKKLGKDPLTLDEVAAELTMG
jgi:hypothetical protein